MIRTLILPMYSHYKVIYNILNRIIKALLSSSSLFYMMIMMMMMLSSDLLMCCMLINVHIIIFAYSYYILLT